MTKKSTRIKKRNHAIAAGQMIDNLRQIAQMPKRSDLTAEERAYQLTQIFALDYTQSGKEPKVAAIDVFCGK